MSGGTRGRASNAPCDRPRSCVAEPELAQPKSLSPQKLRRIPLHPGMKGRKTPRFRELDGSDHQTHNPKVAPRIARAYPGKMRELADVTFSRAAQESGGSAPIAGDVMIGGLSTAASGQQSDQHRQRCSDRWRLPSGGPVTGHPSIRVLRLSSAQPLRHDADRTTTGRTYRSFLPTRRLRRTKYDSLHVDPIDA